VYNPPDSQQPIRSQTQLQSSPPQPPQQQVSYTHSELHMPDMFTLTRALVNVCAFISVSICVSLSGGSVLVCLLHSSTDVACHTLTAILNSMYHSATCWLFAARVCVCVCLCLCVCGRPRLLSDLLSLDRQIDDLSSQIAHVTVSCQSPGDAPPLYPPGQGYIYAAPPPPNPTNYCQPSPQVKTRGHIQFLHQVCIQDWLI